MKAPTSLEDSRRLTGHNRWFAGTAVVLPPLGPAARDTVVQAAWAAVAIVTNISADRLGESGVDDVAEVEFTVARALAPGGTLVLNADDPALMAAACQHPQPSQARQALFGLAHEALAGPDTCGTSGGRLLLRHRQPDEETAARTLLAWALSGAVVVLPIRTAAVGQRLAATLKGD